MGNKVNKIVHSRLFVIILVGILILTTILFGTYAWFTWSSTDNTVFNMTIGKVADVTFEGGNAITGNLEPVFNYYDGLSTTFSINNGTSSDEDVYYKIDFNITSIDPALSSNASDIKYTILKGGIILEEGDLSGADNNTTITLYNGKLDSGVTEYIVYLYIDGNAENDISMMGKTLNGNIVVVEGEGNQTFVQFLTNKYMSANPTQATTANNGIYYYYAPSVNMMNDGMGSNHTWEDGANTGNIRYYGVTPSNYIDIGDRDASGNVIPWRIIGVFKNMTLADGSTDTLIKVIREQPLSSDMKWDDDYNDWHNATLQTYLNTGGYYTGLSQSVKDKIAKVEWNLGGWDTSNGVYSNMIYEKERGTAKCSTCTYNTIWEGNIALMYPSDYGYAADLTKCSKEPYNYNTDKTNCTGTDWLFNSKNQWLLTPYSSNAASAWFVHSSGYVSYRDSVFRSYGVRPVLYLSSELGIESGDGTTVESAYVVR